MKQIKQFLVLVAALLLISSVASAQAALTQTTLAANVTTSSVNTIRVTSATGFAVGNYLFMDGELDRITSVSGVNIGVVRGLDGTYAYPHNTGTIILTGPPGSFTSLPRDPEGRCVATQFATLPLVNVTTGSIIGCVSSTYEIWHSAVATVYSPLNLNLDLESISDTKPVRINSRDYVQATGSSIGFQVKPSQAVTSTGSVIGGEISPRVASGVALGNVTGLHVDTYLKGTAVGTISGNVRGLELEMTTDDAGTRTVGGYVAALRIRSAFSATAITGNFVPIRIEFPESQTNSQTYDAALELTGQIAGVWNSTDAASGDTEAGYIKVIVNGADRYILLFSDVPGA